MRLRLDMLNNGRRLRVVTAAAMLTACASTQANEVPGYGFESAAQEITQRSGSPRPPCAPDSRRCGLVRLPDALLSDHLSGAPPASCDGDPGRLRGAVRQGGGRCRRELREPPLGPGLDELSERSRRAR